MPWHLWLKKAATIRCIHTTNSCFLTTYGWIMDFKDIELQLKRLNSNGVNQLL